MSMCIRELKIKRKERNIKKNTKKYLKKKIKKRNRNNGNGKKFNDNGNGNNHFNIEDKYKTVDNCLHCSGGYLRYSMRDSAGWSRPCFRCIKCGRLHMLEGNRIELLG